MNVALDRTNVKISGRTTKVGDTLYLGYSGAYVEFEATTARVQVTFCTDREVMEEIYRGWVAVHIDGAKEPSMRFELTQPEQTVTIFEEAAARKVKIRIVKMSEAAFGIVGIKDLFVECDTPVIPTPAKDRRIEFIGDSITCGYGNEGINGKDVFCTAQENPEDAYAILTADKLDADYHLVSWSGIGIITNWVPETAEEPLEEILMPDLYQYRDLRLAEKLGLPKEKWDFGEYVPDLVVIFIGTNDDSYVRNKADRKENFGRRYYKFLEQVHESNPDSAILCILGTMGQNLCEEEAERVETFRKAYPAVRIEAIEMPQQLEEDGIGSDGHPSKITHRKAAELLSSKIREFMGW